jgi:hypothetical protein
MLIQMVRPGEETEDTRQRTVLPAGNEIALAVIRRLADARLVVTARDAASGAETVEVTHEALIRHWTLLRTWIDEDREFLRSKTRLEAAAALWDRDKRDASRLLPAGRALAEGEEMLASRREDLGTRSARTTNTITPLPSDGVYLREWGESAPPMPCIAVEPCSFPVKAVTVRLHAWPLSMAVAFVPVQVCKII